MSGLLAHRILLMAAACASYIVGAPTGQAFQLLNAVWGSDNPVNPVGGTFHLCNEVVP